MYEPRLRPLLSRAAFALRFARNAAFGFLLILMSLGTGMLGYHYLESMPWIDAFANASMILSGMGPLEPMKTNAGKIFAGCYALYSGLAIIIITGIIFAPVIHRFLHRFHLEDDEASERPSIARVSD